MESWPRLHGTAGRRMTPTCRDTSVTCGPMLLPVPNGPILPPVDPSWRLYHANLTLPTANGRGFSRPAGEAQWAAVPAPAGSALYDGGVPAETDG
jgi:hypothetical protein